MMTKLLSLSMMTVALLASALAWAAQDPVELEAEALSSAATQPSETGPLQTTQDKLSYSLGMDIAKVLQQRDLDVDVDILAQGIRDKLAGDDTLLTAEQAQEVMRAWQKRAREAYMEKQKELAEKNEKAGEAFLAENAKKEDVMVLPSGLQYKVIEEGSEGPKPELNDRVKVHYRGTLLDGTEFDSSYKRNQPMTFTVKTGRGGVIAGWVEALQLMKPGAKWKVFVPPDLAYGERARGRQIGPNSTLIFEMELLSIEPPATQPAERPARIRPRPPTRAPKTQPSE
jgi:FKBP-type peptidyl-prolyl cis-trans isomerase FklB